MLIEKLPEGLREKLVRFLFRGKKKTDFYQRLKDGDANGQQMLSTLGTMRGYYRKKNRLEAIVVEKVISNLYLGQNVTLAMQDYVSGIEQIMLSTSSQIGLQGALERCMIVERRKMEIQSLFLRKMWSPVLKILAIVVALGFLGKKVLPELFASIGAETMPTQLNPFSKMLFSLVDFTNSMYAPLSLAIFVSLVLAFFFSLKRWTGPVREKLDAVTPYGLYRVMVGTGWLSSVSIMISSGISVKDALRNSLRMASDNRWLSERITAILDNFGSCSFGFAMVRSGFAFPDKDLIDEMEILAEQGVDSSRYLVLADEWAENGIKTVEFQISSLSMVVGILFYIMAAVFVLGILLFVQDLLNSATGPAGF